MTTRILFVCMGNICRSPLAEGIFNHLAAEAGRADEFIVDSCGTGGWHAGELPDPRSRAVAEKHGLSLRHRARQFERADFNRFDLIVTMDRDNEADLLLFPNLSEQVQKKIHLMREWDPESVDNDGDREVPDPYYSISADGFEDLYQMLDRSARRLLESLPRTA